jgi:hypothetical protein
MSKRRKPKKPRGKMGVVQLSQNRKDALIVEFTLPASKEEIESFVLEEMINSIKRTGVDPYQLLSVPIQNSENDFDFTLHTATGIEYLDLLEVAPLENFRGAYENAPSVYKVGELADAILYQISKKNQRYDAHCEIHLLLYSTDWRFYLEPEVLMFLSYQCSSMDLTFKSIVYFSPLSEHSTPTLVLPQPREAFSSYNAEYAYQHIICLISAETAEHLADGKIRIKIPEVDGAHIEKYGVTFTIVYGFLV